MFLCYGLGIIVCATHATALWAFVAGVGIGIMSHLSVAWVERYARS